MAATVQAQIANGAGPTLASAEGGIRYGRDDLVTSTATIPIPTATGTKYSYFKELALVVTGTSTTSITNRRISWATNPASGLFGFFKNQPTYTQNNGTQGTAAGNYPVDSASNANTPTGYTLMSTTPQLWDNTSVATSSAAKNGNYVETVTAADFTYAGGGNSATAGPNITLTYDEA